MLSHFMAAYADVKTPRYSQDHMVAAAKLLVLPILEASFDRGEEVVNGELLDSMVKHIFDAPDDLAGKCQEASRNEARRGKCWKACMKDLRGKTPGQLAICKLAGRFQEQLPQSMNKL